MSRKVAKFYDAFRLMPVEQLRKERQPFLLICPDDERDEVVRIAPDLFGKQ
jgi:hypothetical protein